MSPHTKRNVKTAPYETIEDISTSIFHYIYDKCQTEHHYQIYTENGMISITAIEGRINASIFRNALSEDPADITLFNISPSNLERLFDTLIKYRDNVDNATEDTIYTLWCEIEREIREKQDA